MNLEDAVLLAIAEGMGNPKYMAKNLNVDLEDVKVAIDNLMAEGLIVKKIRGFIFKKEVYELTKRGFERVERIKEELKKVANDFKIAYESGDRTRLERLYHEYQHFVPLMIMFGLIDAIWLSILLSDFDIAELDDSGFDDIDSDFDIEF